LSPRRWEDNARDLRGGVGLHAEGDVRVDVLGRARARMAEHLGDHLRRDAGPERQRGERVAKAVKRELGEPDIAPWP
jgi:hypothetical protein